MTEMNTIHPSSLLQNCTLGSWIHVGPFCYITDSHIEDHAHIEGNVRIEKSTIASKNEILWGAIIRESVIENSCIIGCEVKRSHVGENTMAKHPGTNISDAVVGKGVNFWSWVKCANYDGKGKGKFTIGNEVFLGCNAVLSVKAGQVRSIGNKSVIGANTHVSFDVPDASLVYTDKENGKITLREKYYES